MKYPHDVQQYTLSMGEENAILAWKFKHVDYAQVAKSNTHIITLKPHYIWGEKMQYMLDILNMHIVGGGGGMQYPHYDP